MRKTLRILPAILTTVATLVAGSVALADDSTAAQRASSPTSQRSTKELQTKLEAFMGSKGTLYIRDIVECGTIDAITAEAVTLFKPGHEEDKTRGFILSASNAVSSVRVRLGWTSNKVFDFHYEGCGLVTDE